ncbi:MAG TPA: trypsin-like peptidase domain-containing protein [Propionibacteriaceae bacterium]|nr:trypsin-like peptidase domain-containing protein [Propionibacteriaceae bacterium]
MSNDFFWSGQHDSSNQHGGASGPASPQPSQPQGPYQANPWGPQEPPRPQPTGTLTQPRRGRRGLATIAAVAVIAGGIGGGTGFALDRALNPATTSTVSSGTGPNDTASGSTVTKVVQGNTSNPDWSVTASNVSKSVVSIIVQSGQSGDEGTGVLLNSQGDIVTNNHVVSGAGSGASVHVQIGNETLNATVVGTDASTDLAVIKIASVPSGLQPITFADSSSVKVGDPVMAVGNPLGLSDTVTTGIVSALNRPVVTQQVSSSATDITGSGAVYTSAIQTSAPINPGNSGGALVNANGELVGINSSIASLSGGNQSGQSGSIGIGFAIPSNQVKYITDQLISTGKAEHAYLGISTTDAAVQVGGATIQGAKVASVVQGTAAASAGLKAGDVITQMNGVTIDSSNSLVAAVRGAKVNEQVTFKVVRNGSFSTVQATLGKAPATGR